MIFPITYFEDREAQNSFSDSNSLSLTAISDAQTLDCDWDAASGMICFMPT